VIRTRFGALGTVVFLGLLTACKENLSVPNPPPGGADIPPPLVQLNPAADTTGDSTGILQIRVRARVQSNLKHVEISITPPTLSFGPSNPGDTAFDVIYPIPLNTFKHSSFRFSILAIDVLDNLTDTPPVTVTVR